MANLEYYIGVILVIVACAFLIKKVAGCIFRIVIAVIALAIIAYFLRSLGYI
ncbi:UNVERIFIED_CONTAM: hypothetical protein NY100_09385 [Prevotella sp. 15_C9]|uniref:hypothetical protein n=1 Tax=Prevotella TaxID=838 RepID=UPI0013EF4F1A|nr:hypothetical protein [Prevotella brunnea]